MCRLWRLFQSVFSLLFPGARVEHDSRLCVYEAMLMKTSQHAVLVFMHAQKESASEGGLCLAYREIMENSMSAGVVCSTEICIVLWGKEQYAANK